jgi:alkylated DNA repair dioxygenase AlkB
MSSSLSSERAMSKRKRLDEEDDSPKPKRQREEAGDDKLELDGERGGGSVQVEGKNDRNNSSSSNPVLAAQQQPLLDLVPPSISPQDTKSGSDTSSSSSTAVSSTTAVAAKRVVQKLQPGLVIIRNALDINQQNALVEQVNNIGKHPKHGFYQPLTRFGAKYNLQMNCIGSKHWDSKRYKYSEKRTNVDGNPPAPLPADIEKIVMECVVEARAIDDQLPPMQVVETTIANYYRQKGGGGGNKDNKGGRLGEHQDISEDQATILAGRPVVSISVGNSMRFSYRLTKEDEKSHIQLRSGDVLIFGGPARLIYHSVDNCEPSTAPPGLRMIPGRLNLTSRQVSERKG